VRLGTGTLVRGEGAFRRFHGEQPDALVVGADCVIDGVVFALGRAARMTIGEHCHLTASILLCEAEVRIGSFVVMGWNTTIADSDFHPLSPARRIADAIACSPRAAGRARPPCATAPVVIEDDVWIGPAAAILKGVRIGAGAFIEPGAVVTREVPPRTRVRGNPARIVGVV
jgi:acetyltransferase-like isoleucine patch superfamily enzyme